MERGGTGNSPPTVGPQYSSKHYVRPAGRKWSFEFPLRQIRSSGVITSVGLPGVSTVHVVDRNAVHGGQQPSFEHSSLSIELPQESGRQLRKSCADKLETSVVPREKNTPPPPEAAHVGRACPKISRRGVAAVSSYRERKPTLYTRCLVHRQCWNAMPARAGRISRSLTNKLLTVRCSHYYKTVGSSKHQNFNNIDMVSISLSAPAKKKKITTK